MALVPHPRPIRKPVSFEIQDDLDAAERSAIEVHVTAGIGPDRWCFFITPQALSICGDLLPGSSVRIHLGVPHMIVASELPQAVIQMALDDLADQGLLLTHTAAIEISQLL